jgi:serine protease
MLNYLKLFPVLVVTVVISSCGGGGGGGSANSASGPVPTVSFSSSSSSVFVTNTSNLTWSSSNATSCTASGEWSGGKSASGSEEVTISIMGDNTFTIKCSGTGGSKSASVTIEGYKNIDGVVVDGYISGAEVFIDEDDDWVVGTAESSTTSDNEGKFTIKYTNGNLVSIGGTDLDTQTLLDNLLFIHKLTNYSDFKVVTPLTSVTAFMADASNINASLGIDVSIDIASFDPVANKGDGGINDYLYKRGNQLTVLAYALQNITNDLNTTTETTQDYFKAIAEEIEKEYTETSGNVYIETEAFITRVLNSVIAAKKFTITDEAKANTVRALSGILSIIEVKPSDDLTTAVTRFAVATLQTDIKAIANGSASAEIVTSYTTDILNFIATDQLVNANEIAPNINAIADSAATPEDTAIEINVLANDFFVNSAPFSLSVTNPPNGNASVSSNQISYTPDGDYNGTDTFTYTITQGEKTSSAEVTMVIEPVNDAPSIDTAATIQAAENQTAVANITVSDVDAEDALTLSLSGTDAENFDLSSDNVLSFKEAPDYEGKNLYSITLSLTDSIETVTKDITVAVTNVNDIAPEFTSESTFSAAENQTAIGSVTATDVEGDAVTFTISGAELRVSASGVLTFASAPDYETKASYAATVTVTDSVNSTTQDITISVTDANDAPIITSPSTFSADEQQLSIGTVVASDQDGNALSFSLASGNSLSINATTGVLAFKTAPDYEVITSFNDTVQVTDGSQQATQIVTVNITETEFEVAGIAYASKYLEIDGDIPNTDYLANDNSNNFVSTAQGITNPALITGFTGHSGDTGDLYKISTSSNMYVNLDVVDYASGVKDLDLSIWNSDGTSRSYTYTSGSTEANETINLPSSGTYLIYVSAYTGSSKYYLTVGQRLTNQSLASSASSASTSEDYVKNEIIAYLPFEENLRNKQKSSFSKKEIAQKVLANDLPLNFTNNTLGLKKFKVSYLVDSIKNELTLAHNGELINSERQLDYLGHWKAKEKMREINPSANYGLNYYVKKMSAFSPDPLYSYQWNLRQIKLDPALNAIGQEVKDIAVAVVDSGSPSVNSTAWGAANFISGGYDFVASTSNGDGDGIDNDPTDPDAVTLGISHGTHVATTIGLKNDGVGLNGMAIKVLPLRVFPAGDEASATVYDIEQAILYAAGLPNASGLVAPTATPVKVINLSLSGGGWDCSFFADIAAQGISVVAASGNDGDEAPGTYNYPASCANVISVGATNSLDERAYYSQYNNMVDISAPGGQFNIDADSDGVADEVHAYVNDSDLGGMQGTSMASPTAAGGIALLYSVDSGMTPTKVNSFIQNGYITDDIGASGYDTKFGYGRLNLAKAVENTLSNIGNTTVTYMYTEQSAVDFGNASTQVDITLRKVGDSALSVSSLAADDATGLSYTSSADGEGVGTYTIYMDRGALPNGEFQNRLYFNLSDSTKISIGAYYKVGADKTRPNLGKAYVGLYNGSDEVIASGELDFDGYLSFVANDIVDGNYYFIVSTDIDDDNFICGYGELCEYYPEYGSQVPMFEVKGSDTENAQIYVSPTFKYGGINAASVGSGDNLNSGGKVARASSENKIQKIYTLIGSENNKDEMTRIPKNAIPFSIN